LKHLEESVAPCAHSRHNPALLDFPRPDKMTPCSSKQDYRPDIDGLRAFSVLAVVGYHFFPLWVKGGFIGVDIFFVISGFLIGGILLDSRRNGTFSLRDFYARRIRRIFPALIVVMVASLAFGWFALLPDDYLNLGKHAAGGAGFIANLLFWQEAGYFDVAAERKPLLHLWSLGIEEQFYIFFPLFLWGLWKKSLRPFTFILLLTFLSYRWNLATYKHQAAFDFYLPVTRFWELLAGVLLALWERRRREETSAVSAPRWWHPYRQELAQGARRIFFLDAEATVQQQMETFRSFLSIAGILLLAFAAIKTQTAKFPGKQALIPVLGAICLIAAGPKAWANRVLLAFRPVVWIGLISYPLYLWHWPLLSYARIILGETPNLGFLIGILGLAFILAALTYWLVERPLRFGKRARKIKTMALVISLVIVGCTGGWVFLEKGLENRKSVQNAKAVIEELKQGFLLNDICHKQYGDHETFCYYHNIEAKNTIVVIGDSHARFAFPEIARFGEQKGYNTLTIGGIGWHNPITGKTADPQFIEKMHKLLDENKTIKKVFLITRGNLYINGYDIDNPLTEEHDRIQYSYNGMQGMEQAIQKAIDRLRSMGKSVFLVAENPVWPKGLDIRTIFGVQPLRHLLYPEHKEIHLYKADVLENQKEYLEMLGRLQGATIIHTIDAFCPGKECLLSDENGLPLYGDDDHLSQTGGKFLVEKILKPYLDD
jgi:peptidoglycan/LPS O-acetylase OafA/YrhL